MLRKLLPFLIYALEMKISYQIFLQLLIIKMIIDSKRITKMKLLSYGIFPAYAKFSSEKKIKKKKK